MFLRRWEVEPLFDDMKTSQGMDMLGTHSPHMVARELLMHLIVHNLVRLIQTEAQQQGTDEVIGDVSFRGALDRITLSHDAMWGATSRKAAKLVRANLIKAVAQDVVRARPGRREPRLKKRRPKNYGLLTQPRADPRHVQKPRTDPRPGRPRSLPGIGIDLSRFPTCSINGIALK
jgi:hypothetical protein